MLRRKTEHCLGFTDKFLFAVGAGDRDLSLVPGYPDGLMASGTVIVPMLLVLLVGHGINFALCMISSFVHPMRLTFVEFFKNASFDGGGKEYSPFKIRQYKRD